MSSTIVMSPAVDERAEAEIKTRGLQDEGFVVEVM